MTTLLLTTYVAYEFIKQTSARVVALLALLWAFYLLFVPSLPAANLAANAIFVGWMTILVVVGTENFRGLIQTPSLELFLSKPISRSSLVLSMYLGTVVASGVLVAVLGLLWGGAFFVRTGSIVPSIPGTCLAIIAGFGALFPFIVAVSLVLRETYIPLVGAVIYVLFGAGFLEMQHSGFPPGLTVPMEDRLADALYYSLPQLIAMKRDLLGVIRGAGFAYAASAHAAALVIGTLSVGVFVFRRSDV